MSRTIIIQRFILGIIVFTIIFILFRTLNPFPLSTLENNLNSIPWLYSTIGLIFGVISGFIVQHQWHMWDNLLDASQKEINAIRQLYNLSKHFPEKLKLSIQEQIITYLDLLIRELWKNIDKGVRSKKIEATIFELENTLYTEMEHLPKRSETAVKLFGEIITNREYRLRFGAYHMPDTLRWFIVYITGTMIILAFFIRIDNVFLDYIFTFSIALLSYAVYVIIDDLDHPYRPGNWHLSTKSYNKLLEEIQENALLEEQTNVAPRS
jgi:hypothetical protein